MESEERNCTNPLPRSLSNFNNLPCLLLKLIYVRIAVYYYTSLVWHTSLIYLTVCKLYSIVYKNDINTSILFHHALKLIMS